LGSKEIHVNKRREINPIRKNQSSVRVNSVGSTGGEHARTIWGGKRNRSWENKEVAAVQKRWQTKFLRKGRGIDERERIDPGTVRKGRGSCEVGWKGGDTKGTVSNPKIKQKKHKLVDRFRGLREVRRCESGGGGGVGRRRGGYGGRGDWGRKKGKGLGW